jgi:hypothetical protein
MNDTTDAVETHRAAYTLLSQAEAAFDAPDVDEEGPLKGAMLAALRIERRLYDVLLTAQPRTAEGKAELIRYVDGVARQQGGKGHHDSGPEILAANLKESV